MMALESLVLDLTFGPFEGLVVGSGFGLFEPLADRGDDPFRQAKPYQVEDVRLLT